MKKYLALYMASPAAIKTMMKIEDIKGEMDMWMAWAKANKAGIVDLGTPLGKTKHLTAKRMTNTKNGITGWTVVQANSPEAAQKIFANCPHFRFKGTSIDLIECLQM
jgi:hypothetical protein